MEPPTDSFNIRSALLVCLPVCEAEKAARAYSLVLPGILMCFMFYQADVLVYDLRGQGNEVGAIWL